MKYEITSTETFNKWFGKLKDLTVKQQLLARFARLENGNFGDFKQLGQKLFELRCSLPVVCESIIPSAARKSSCC
jgi:putative addiction module killer protein